MPDGARADRRHMRRFAVALVLLALIAAAPASAIIRPQKGMSGVTLGMTKAQVRARLGSPIGSGGGRLYFALRLGRLPVRPRGRDHDDALERAHGLRGRRRFVRGRGPPRVPVGRVRAVRRLPQVPARKRPARHARDRLPARPRQGPADHDLASPGVETPPRWSNLPGQGDMLRKRHAFYLVLVAALWAFVAALPASAHAHHVRIPCMGDPDFVGHMGDAERLVPVPRRPRRRAHQRGHVHARDRRHVEHAELPAARPDLGRNARRPRNERPRSERGMLDGDARRRRLRVDLGRRPDRIPARAGHGSPEPATRRLHRRRPSPAGPPPPPPPPAQPDLILTVGPDPRIAAFYADGRPVTNLPPGTYTIQVHDLSATHNFHLTGPGVDEKTSVGDIEHPVWRLTLRAGKYTFKCDVHPTIKGSFTVSTNAPPVPKCKVPRVIGKGLSQGEALDPRRALLGRPRPLPAFEAREGAHRPPEPGRRPHARGRKQGQPGRQPRARVTATTPFRGIPAARGAD